MILLSKIKERSFSANIESLWNTKTWGTPVQLALPKVKFLLGEEHGKPSPLSIPLFLVYVKNPNPTKDWGGRG